jgi:hypothetical protein
MLDEKHIHSIPFWILTLSIFFILTLPFLIKDAMFQDAMLYSSVSHNLGIGFGTFWFPQYSTLNIAGLTSFHEHPPLVYGIQSVFYWMFGDSIYIEKFYTLGMIILTMILINWLWKKVSKNKPEMLQLNWLPVFYWSIVPIVFWNYRYNMMENTMGIFILLSVITSYHNLKFAGNKLGLWLLSGFLIFLASFSKGIPGLFPVVVPFLYWIATKRITFKQSILYSIILCSVPIIIYGILLLFPDSRESLMDYFLKRVLWRIDQLPTTQYRVLIIVSLFKELLPMIIGTAIALTVNKLNKIKNISSDNLKDAVFFILTGSAGAIPLALTFCQRDWYLVPTFPYFAVGFAIITAPTLSIYINKINIRSVKFNTFLISSVIIFISVLTYTGMQKGKIGRDEDVVTDVYKIGAVVPRFSTITVPPEMYDETDFVLQGFLVRYFNISISPYKQYDYFLKEKKIKSPPYNYIQVNLKLTRYELYKTKSY